MQWPRAFRLPFSHKHDVSLLKASQFFDEQWYLEINPDVRAAGVDPTTHYVLHGAKEGRDPSKFFSTSRYLDQHQELRVTGVNPLVHHLSRLGHAEPGGAVRHSGVPSPDADELSVPRIFHHIWLSNDPVPPALRLGVETFVRFHPEFSVRRWTAEDISEEPSPFLHAAIKHRKWAFAADYVRLKALFEFGGVYADGDVAFYRRIDEYFHYECVFAWENSFAVGPHFLAARPRHPIIGRLLQIYQERDFLRGNHIDLTPMPIICTWVLAIEYG